MAGGEQGAGGAGGGVVLAGAGKGGSCVVGCLGLHFFCFMAKILCRLYSSAVALLLSVASSGSGLGSGSGTSVSCTMCTSMVLKLNESWEGGLHWSGMILLKVVGEGAGRLPEASQVSMPCFRL